ncbi:hypothetical protein CAPTEDRAFT_207378 [Capitella teleta]|uniref:Uncharacterized protein n=1 Tax=Capitella teleta TaxID=283909 RepID=R7UES1_CAPTE|nr:hypothetical protein CAPTEDRAFT_207378 [Capitella teleta]|eukprot:ELU04576.1 hypothetical protein CAPTEDRAFT_207378 [Capitella teleta]
MSFSLRCVLGAILYFAIAKPCHSTIEFSEQGLTSLQQTWPSYHYEIKIVARSNNISEISAVESNCSDSPLKRLNLKGNRIWRIEVDSFRTCQLTYLNLVENKLTSIPDLRNIGGTLEKLHIGGNQIEIVRVSDISYMVELTELYLGPNPTVSFPDLTYHLPTLQYLEINTIILDCCQDYAWLKNAANLTIVTDVEPCINPPKWVAQNWTSLQYDELLTEPCADHGFWLCMIAVGGSQLNPSESSVSYVSPSYDLAKEASCHENSQLLPLE